MFMFRRKWKCVGSFDMRKSIRERVTDSVFNSKEPETAAHDLETLFIFRKKAQFIYLKKMPEDTNKQQTK